MPTLRSAKHDLLFGSVTSPPVKPGIASPVHRLLIDFRRHRLSCTAFQSSTESYRIVDIDIFSRYSGYIAAASATETEFLEEYDANQIAAIFKKRRVLLARRMLQIISTLGRWAALRYLDSLLGRSEFMFKERAGELREALVKLGPAFVKIAQAVSSRPDVVSPAYLDELSLLQDRIAPFATDIALETIEKELGVPIDLLFSEITPEPVAAASLGQVYQARLRPNGKIVAVKVQRPGVRAAIALDVFILRILAGFVRRAGRFNTDLQAVVDEWASSLFREMDYGAEALNGLRFRKTFGSIPDVVVPEMFPELSSRQVLVMEWIDGKKLTDVNDLHLIEVGVYCSLTQLLHNGFYHADPHPGNLMRTYNGKLAYLDFGMMGEIKKNLRDALIEACLHLVNRDFEALAEDFVSLGFIPAGSQTNDVSLALTGVFQNAVSKGVRNLSFGDLSGNLGRTMYKFKFRIPSYFSLVVRSLTVLEGIALSIDPNYKVLSSAYPWIARKVLTDTSPQLRATLKALLYKDGVFQIDRLESLMTESLQSATIESLMNKERGQESGKRLIVKKVLNFVLSGQGDFVRETLLDEVAKGLDALSRATFESAFGTVVSNLPFGSRQSDVPKLLEEEDLKNLATLSRLSTIISKGLVENASATEKENVDAQIAKSLDHQDIYLFLQSNLKYIPDLLVLSDLPLTAQQQALFLPGQVMGRLTSRVIARSIRRTVARAAENITTGGV